MKRSSTLRLLLCRCVSFGLLGVAFAARAQAPASFALQPGDRVVFYGDSITEQRFYTNWVELYVATRFPQLHARFFVAGMGGDRVSGGGAGTADERLARDVFAHQPTAVTIMLGMNDGGYAPLTPAVEQTYVKGYEHLLQSIREHAPAARVTLIGPSPYDEVTRTKPLFAGGYNSALLRFGAIDQELATRFGGTFADANRPFIAALQRAVQQNALAAQMLVPDRVHPANPAHLLIAMALLRAWHAPALVSDTQLDAAAASSEGSRNVQVTELAAHAGGIRWASLEDALPVPMDPGDAAVNFANQVSGFTEEFNQERLLVRNLRPGSYLLSIDGDAVSSFSADELAKGVNLAQLRTPMRQQAYPVSWKIRDREDLQYVRMRLQVEHATPEAVQALTPTEDEMQQVLWKQAEPVVHRFELRPEASAAKP